MRNLLAVSISHNGETYGRLYLCDKTDGGFFGADDELLVATFADTLALAIRNIWNKEGCRRVFGERYNGKIIRAIIDLAHNLDLQVVAERVESPEQLEFLRSHHCHFVQGYLFGLPLPLSEIAQLAGRRIDRSGRLN